jgi:hypothetical protein
VHSISEKKRGEKENKKEEKKENIMEGNLDILQHQSKR